MLLSVTRVTYSFRICRSEGVWLCTLYHCWHDECQGNLQAIGPTFVLSWPGVVGACMVSRASDCRLE